jgi:hypothetical protein
MPKNAPTKTSGIDRDGRAPRILCKGLFGQHAGKEADR